MTPAQELNQYCDARQLTCPKCRFTAHVILRLMGLQRAIDFVWRQRPH